MSLTFNTMNSFYHSENEGRMTCPVCGKKFDPAPEHAYHIKRGQKNFVCSWSCMRKWEKGEVKGLKPQEVKPKPKRYKAVRVVETGEIFNSAKECAEKLCEDRLPNDPVVIAVKVELEMVGEYK